MKNKTVYIVGAGASCEAGLPTGLTLRDAIANLLNLQFDFGRQQNGDYIIAEALRAQLQQTGDRSGGGTYISAAQRLRAGMAYAVSIDNYLHQHRGDKEAELCGKLAIVRAILQAESNSRMQLKSHQPAHEFPQSKLTETWYARMWQVLTDGCHVDDLRARFESVAFVVFNYDRCIEHYLYNALQAFYGLSASDARGLLQALEIRHPYGTVGYLPWSGHDQSLAIDFGGEPHARKLLELSKMIKTFTESVDKDHSDIVAIRSTVRNASKLVILGFGFYEQNMALLWPEKALDRANQGTCYATAYGIKDPDLEVIRGDLMDLTGMATRHVHVRNDLKSCELFGEFQRGLRIR